MYDLCLPSQLARYMQYIVALDRVVDVIAGIQAMWNIYDIQAVLFLYGRML